MRNHNLGLKRVLFWPGADRSGRSSACSSDGSNGCYGVSGIGTCHTPCIVVAHARAHAFTVAKWVIGQSSAKAPALAVAQAGVFSNHRVEYVKPLSQHNRGRDCRSA
jgi:hypothetical protein